MDSSTLIHSEYLNRINTVLDQNGLFTNELESDTLLELDSLTLISIMISLENEFNISFPDDSLVEIPQTYQGLTQFVIANIDEQLLGDGLINNMHEGGETNEET